jgi:glycerol-1-phosphate dehydrogenase [NAD(P)+]
MQKQDPFSKLNDPAAWHEQVGPEIMESWMGQARTCPACGRVHSIKTRRISSLKLGTREISRNLTDLGFSGHCIVVMDQKTRQAAGLELLDDLAPFRPRAVIFDRIDLHADESAIGTLLTGCADKPDFLVSCGSGTLTDITRFNSLMTGIPFVSFATAASVDGFASSSTPLIVRGFKQTYPGVAPEAIFFDPEVLAGAPEAMTAAGFGDVCAKIIALIDWRMAFAVEDEFYCPLIASVIDRAVNESLKLAQDMADGKSTAEKVCTSLMESLSLTGMGMQMAGNSRPASGGEHHISHLLEMLDIQRHRSGSLHGDKVGIGTLISMAMYMRLFEGGGLPAQRPVMAAYQWEKEIRRVYGLLADQAIEINSPEPPQGAEWERQVACIDRAMESFGYATVRSFKTLLPKTRDLIRGMGGPIRPDLLGYSVQDTYDAIAFGKEVRPKWTITRMAERFGWLYDLAGEFAEGLPEGIIY